MLTPIRLETQEGDFVAYGGILPFPIFPEVVLWGQRIFLLHSTIEETFTDPRVLETVARLGAHATYREVFYTTVLPLDQNA